MKTIVAVDPGAKGGVAWINANGVGAESLADLTDKGLLRLLKQILLDATTDGIIAYVEQVNSMSPGRRACFVLGGSYRACRMALAATEIPFKLVLASEWQKGLGVPKKTTYAKRKKYLQGKAEEVFPQLEVTPDIADALLIMEWGRRQP